MSACTELYRYAKAGVPLVHVDSHDPMGLVADVSTSNKMHNVRWDCVRGFSGVTQADRGIADAMMQMAMAGTMPGMPPPVMGDNPDWLAMDAVLRKMPANTRLFITQASEWWKRATFAAMLAGLRDELKRDQRQIVTVDYTFTAPQPIASDILCLDHALPDADELTELAMKIADCAKVSISKTDAERAANLCIGVGKFPAEQNLAVSIKPTGYDYGKLMERRASTIKGFRGLEMVLPTITFEDIGGLMPVKEFLTRLISNNSDIAGVLWWDEIDRSTGGEHETSQDQMGTILQQLADNHWPGVLLMGHPGVGKSELCKAMAGQFGCPCLRFDFGAFQSKWVGETGEFTRAAFKVARGMSQGKKMLVLATANMNNPDKVDDAMLSRFPWQFFFPFMTEDQLALIWQVQMRRHELKDSIPPCERWSGRDVYNCCNTAKMTGVSLAEAAKLIIPEGLRASHLTEKRCRNASGRCLDANVGGVYDMNRVADASRSITL